MIGIEYTEFKPGTYKSVWLYSEGKKIKEFKSGDPVIDFAYAVSYAQGKNINYSSTIDNFLSDHKGLYSYDENNFIVKKE